MIILSLRTDKPEAEIGVFDDDKKLAYETWQAHRQLAETIHKKIKSILESLGLELNDIQAVVCYQGPGSFTGLRIGLSVANALAGGLEIPIVGATGETWLDNSLTQIRAGKNNQQVIPEYGAPIHITKPKK